MTDLYSSFKRNLSRNPDRTFLIYEGKEISWSEMDGICGAVSSKLDELGLSNGDRVGIFLTNCPEYIGILLAIFRLNLTAVPINTYLKRNELHSIIENGRISTIFTNDKLVETVLKTDEESDILALINILSQ